MLKFIKKIPKKLPTHIGFILDGNGRWAKERGLPRNAGHKAGVEAIRNTVDSLLKFGIPYASMFAFSTENWKRSKEEVDGIFNLVRNLFMQETEDFDSKGVKINFFGDLTPFDDELKEIFNKVLEKTKNNTKLTLNICLNYGGKADIVQAVKKLLEKNKQVSEDEISNHLYSAGQPDLDFIIRTSGEMRISNFMIYQGAYAELYFPKVYWPDFNERELLKALAVFAKRKRRYGGY